MPSSAAVQVFRIDPIWMPNSALSDPARMPPRGIRKTDMPNRRTLSEMKIGRAISADDDRSPSARVAMQDDGGGPGQNRRDGGGRWRPRVATS